MTPEVFTRFIYWLYIIIWILLGMMIAGTALIGIWALLILIINKRRKRHGEGRQRKVNNGGEVIRNEKSRNTSEDTGHANVHQGMSSSDIRVQADDKNCR